MKLIPFVVLLLFLGTGADRVAEAARRELIKIGVLTDSWGPTPGVLGLRDGLRELGYRENRDFFIGVRFTQGNVQELPKAAHELIAQGIDLLFTNNPAPAQAAQKATDRIPIVFYGAGDPQGLGLIKTFARPGGNITGITDLDLDLDTKRLENFKELVPGLQRVFFAYDPSEDLSVAQAKVYRDTASYLRLDFQEKPVTSKEEAQKTFARIEKSETDGIIAPRSLSFNIPGLVIQATLQKRIPTMFFGSWYVEQGGFASYGTNFYESGRMAARLVDKIIKGTKPSEIPVEVNHKLEFVVNLRVAKNLGIQIPPAILYRANRVIR